MKHFKILSLLACCIGLACAVACTKAEAESLPALKDAFASDFMIGAAINTDQVLGRDSLATAIIKKHFNTIVSENAMKSENINPRQGYYNWGPADEFVKFGNDNDMFVVGHCLVWHSQLAKWFPYDDEGNYVSPDTLKERMREFIFAVMSRYKGKVQAWDVVNEAIMDDGSYRKSPFYEILGEEYIPYAFELAYEADPDAELYINDYGMDKPARRDRYVQIVNDLKARGLRIDAIGMQGHMGMDYPEYDEFEDAIEAFASTGCNVMLTEWDMSALPTIHESANVAETVDYEKEYNPYPDGLPSEVAAEWNERMGAILDICRKHSDVITRINAWGVIDSDSWKNDWPMPGRVEYPLLFDRDYNMKPFLIERLKAEG